jgi:preprotein translocase subunit SecD
VSGRTVIESYLVELAIRDTRFAVPPDRMLAYEHVTPERTAPYWRTYLVEREVIAESIRNATAARDQNELPAVQITLDRAGTATLAAATTRHVGRKLVFLIDHRVASAPIIEEPITEGRLWIPIRRGEPARMEHEARELAIVLRSGALPGAVREETRGVLVDGVAKYEGP